MRREVDEYTPWLAHYFGVRPWEVRLLTLRQFRALRDTAVELMKRGSLGG